jgi:hypothetical protein
MKLLRLFTALCLLTLTGLAPEDRDDHEDYDHYVNGNREGIVSVMRTATAISAQ